MRQPHTPCLLHAPHQATDQKPTHLAAPQHTAQRSTTCRSTETGTGVCTHAETQRQSERKRHTHTHTDTQTDRQTDRYTKTHIPTLTQAPCTSRSLVHVAREWLPNRSPWPCLHQYGFCESGTLRLITFTVDVSGFGLESWADAQGVSCGEVWVCICCPACAPQPLMAELMRQRHLISVGLKLHPRLGRTSLASTSQQNADAARRMVSKIPLDNSYWHRIGQSTICLGRMRQTVRMILPQ